MKYGQYKRFFELYHGDPEFARGFQRSPEETLAEGGLAIDHRLLEAIQDEAPEGGGGPDSLLELEREAYKRLFDQKYIERLRGDGIRDDGFRAWRSRQKRRTQGLFPRNYRDAMVHLPLAFELSRGCSVGCPFCAFSPPPLQGVFEYTEENARLWRGVLAVGKEIFGDFAGTSLCYFATEPFDNPDYERFCTDFFDLFGMFPRTTTSQYLDNPGRTRNLIGLMRRLDRVCLRLSVTSLGSLRALCGEFGPDELAEVPLCLNNRESSARYSDSGRVRGWSAERRRGKVHESGSVSCLSGFLINMVDRSVRLVTPCNPSDEHPFGYLEYGRAAFTTAADFDSQLRRMIHAHMPLEWPVEKALHFRSDLAFMGLDNGFELSNRFQRLRFTSDVFLRRVGELIHRGDASVQEIEGEMGPYFVSPGYVAAAVEALFEAGVVEESPDPAPAPQG